MTEKTVRRFHPKGGEPRPRCTLCGKPYASRNVERTTIYVPQGEAVPRYAGNQMLVCEVVDPNFKRRRADAPSTTPGHYDPALYDEKFYEHVSRVSRETWDGSWRGGHDPFCTLDCALDFARAAYRDGARYVRKKEA